MAWPACIACEWWSDSGAMFGDSALLVYRVTELRETERDGECRPGRSLRLGFSNTSL